MPCAGCGADVDALRAGSVAVFDGRIAHFCDRACRDRFVARGPSGVVPVRVPPPATRVVHDVPPDSRPDADAAPPPTDPIVDVAPEEPPEDATATSNEVETLLLGTAAIAGVLSVALALMGSAPVVTGARAAVAAVGAMAFAARTMASPRDRGDAHPWMLAATPLLASVVAIAARAQNDPAAIDATTLAGVIVTVAAVLGAMRRSALADVDVERTWIEAALAMPGRRVGRDDVTIVAAHELRAGESIRVERGEIAPADFVVTSGHARVFPWLGATVAVVKREGDPVVAGARVLEGGLEGIASWTGDDRAWARLVLDPERRIDVRSTICKISRRVAVEGALAAAALVGVATWASTERWVDVAIAAVAAHAALATTTVASVAGLHAMRGVLAAARRGIAYRSPEAWDAAARVSAVVFLARGTLLLGEPDVVEVEPSEGRDAATVLAWVAGAEAGETHPIAVAIRRAIRHRGVRADAVRSAHVLPGLGVRAVTSTGEPLLVGSRALMLEERISIALAESRVAELESLGRTVLLVAVGGRLAGLVALQDGLRPGARAAIQHLLDVEIEPVLLSGDSRETCETIARALDVDHVRPEILPADRAAEIRRLEGSGAKVAVVGRPASDANALAAADVAVALGAAGGSPADAHVTLASDDVRDAALALSLAHRTLAEARTAAMTAIVPGVVGVLAIAFGILPAMFGPLASLVGGVVALLHARTTAGARRDPVTPWDLVVPR